jgi:thiosulfate dehydrogenase [quinone] large subunit
LQLFWGIKTPSCEAFFHIRAQVYNEQSNCLSIDSRAQFFLQGMLVEWWMMSLKFEQKALAGARITLGVIFFWAFLDKLFGLGFSTAADKSWLAGVSPTAGFLKFATAGPLSTMFQSMAGQAWIDWLFMLGLALIGLALLLGIGIQIAGYAGALLVFLMFMAAIPFYAPESHNPLVDEHIVYLFILLSFTQLKVGHWHGFGKAWSKTDWVKKYPVLE